MISDIKQQIIRTVLRRVLSRPCQNTIPRSGPKAKQVNCFAARVNLKGEPYLLLDSFEGDVIKCRRWNGQSFSVETDERVSNFVDAELELYHYYGFNTIEFKGAWNFLYHRYTGGIYIKIAIGRAWQAAAQFLFNRRSLQSQQRLRILRLLVDARFIGQEVGLFSEEKGLTCFDVMNRCYSSRWTDHPDQDSRSAQVEFILESLVASNDAIKDGITYMARPQSVITLEQADEQDRRHRETSRLQWMIVLLTLVIAIATLAQTGLIKLPTMFDFATDYRISLTPM